VHAVYIVVINVKEEGQNFANYVNGINVTLKGMQIFKNMAIMTCLCLIGIPCFIKTRSIEKSYLQRMERIEAILQKGN